MRLPKINGLVLMPSASDNEILKVENQMNTKLPNSYKDIIKTSNGLSTGEGILIYGTQDIIERNENWETQIYAPGYIAIGDDSGGGVFIMPQGEEEKKVLISDSGDMTPEHFELVTSDFTIWVKSGFLINIDKIKEEGSWSNNCKIVLIESPDGGLKDLLKIKSVFGLTISAADLLKGSKNLPYIIEEEFPYGKAKKLIEKLEDIKVELRDTKQ